MFSLVEGEVAGSHAGVKGGGTGSGRAFDAGGDEAVSLRLEGEWGVCVPDVYVAVEGGVGVVGEVEVEIADAEPKVVRSRVGVEVDVDVTDVHVELDGA